MTRARSQQIALTETPYYHCVSRCVRRAYLCGDDPVSGKNFDHRKQWLVVRIKELAANFAIDVCAYAVMSNHYHLVLHVNQEQLVQWSEEEVIRHWTAVFPNNGKLVETLHLNRKSKAAQKMLKARVKEWRTRLGDISWFMRCLNESLARRANREDECTGRFWEGRFKSQALLDEKALVTCMAYVDLNPIRAGTSGSLEESDFTSIQERLVAQAKKEETQSYGDRRLLMRMAASHLLEKQSAGRQSDLFAINEMPGCTGDKVGITQHSYVEALKSTVRAIAVLPFDKQKALSSLRDRPGALAEIRIGPDSWLDAIQNFNRYYAQAAGSEASLISFHQHRMKYGEKFKYPDKWIRGRIPARQLFGNAR